MSFASKETAMTIDFLLGDIGYIPPTYGTCSALLPWALYVLTRYILKAIMSRIRQVSHYRQVQPSWIRTVKSVANDSTELAIYNHKIDY